MTQAMKRFVTNPPPGVDKKEALRNKFRLDRYIAKQIKKEDDKDKLNRTLDRAQIELTELININDNTPDLHEDVLNDAVRLIQRLKFDLTQISHKSKLENNYFEICRKIRETFNQIPRECYFIDYIDKNGMISKILINNLRIGIPNGASECSFMFDIKEGSFLIHKLLPVHNIMNIKKI